MSLVAFLTQATTLRRGAGLVTGTATTSAGTVVAKTSRGSMVSPMPAATNASAVW